MVREAGFGEHTAQDETAMETVAGGSMVEAATGVGAIVLTILGIIDILPDLFGSIAVIVVGAGLLFAGGTIASQYSKLMSEAGGGGAGATEAGGGMSIEILGGIAGVVLGILTLIGLEFTPLNPIAVIVFGAALLLGSGTLYRLNAISIVYGGHETTQHVARESMWATMAAQMLIGIGGAALGILALVGVGDPVTLTLIALLAFGASLLISGSALGTKMMALVES